jgi:hypothetical protein
MARWNLILAIALCGTFAFGGETKTPDAQSLKELGEQVHVIKRRARVEKANAFRNFKASRKESRAKALRGEAATATKVEGALEGK